MFTSFLFDFGLITDRFFRSIAGCFFGLLLCCFAVPRVDDEDD